MSLLSVVRDVALEVGLSQPDSAASLDQNSKELTYAVYRAGKLLCAEHDWSALQTAGSITGDGVKSTWPFPADFDRFSGRQRIMRQGQSLYAYSALLSPDEVTYFRAVAVSGMQYRVYRRGMNLVFDPVIALNQAVMFEYQSKNWVRRDGKGAVQTIYIDRPTLDSDAFLFDEPLLTLGAVWQWRKSKRLDYEAEQQEWLRLLNLQAGRERSDAPVGTALDMSGIFDPSIPEQIG